MFLHRSALFEEHAEDVGHGRDFRIAGGALTCAINVVMRTVLAFFFAAIFSIILASIVTAIFVPPVWACCSWSC